jgi:FMN phosphatase YigB (HAD superfamily)
MAPRITTLVFDIDKTIYQSEHLSVAYDEAMLLLISRIKQVSLEAAHHLMEVTKTERTRIGKVNSSTEAVLDLGITLDQWIEFSCQHVDPRRFLQPDDQINTVFVDLIETGYKFGFASNNNRVQVLRTFEALGIYNLLKERPMLTISETRRMKPDRTIYIDLLNMLRSLPKEAVAVGDRDSVDLAPAREIGMSTYLVRSLADFYKLPEHLRTLEI